MCVCLRVKLLIDVLVFTKYYNGTLQVNCIGKHLRHCLYLCYKYHCVDVRQLQALYEHAHTATFVRKPAYVCMYVCVEIVEIYLSFILRSITAGA